MKAIAKPRKVSKRDITINQIRAGRALLDWTHDRLSAESGIPRRTLVRLESGSGHPRPATIEAVRVALERAGVVFIERNGGGSGVRFKSRKV